MADPSQYAYIPPTQQNAYAAMTSDQDTPDYVTNDRRSMTSQQARAYGVSKNAQASAIENMDEAKGQKFNRRTRPEDATNYPAY